MCNDGITDLQSKHDTRPSLISEPWYCRIETKHLGVTGQYPVWLFYVFNAWKDKTESSCRCKLKLRHDTTKVYVGDHINITSHSGVSSRFVSFRVAERS